MPCHSPLQIFARLLLEKISDPARDMGALARYAQDWSSFVRVDPDNAARARTMNDEMIDPTQWRQRARFEAHRFGQPRQPDANPRRVALGEFARRLQGRTGWHRQDDIARRGTHAQRKAARRVESLQGNTIHFAAVRNIDMSNLRRRRSTLEQAQHECNVAQSLTESLEYTGGVELDSVEDRRALAAVPTVRQIRTKRQEIRQDEEKVAVESLCLATIVVLDIFTTNRSERFVARILEQYRRARAAIREYNHRENGAGLRQWVS
jgi:hypothetical protein